MHYSWDTEEEFNAWHNSVKASLGIPHPNKNFLTGEVDNTATWTTQYTELRTDDNGIMYARVEESVATEHPENLGVIYKPFYVMEDEF